VPANRNGNLRRRIAVDAARILAESGDHQYAKAGRKAAERLGCRDPRQLPSNSEIEQALREHQQLFRGPEQAGELLRLRQLALEAMESLQTFNPRLAGPVLAGTADHHSRIELHLFCDSPEQIVFHLMEQRIPWRDGEKRLRYPQGVVRRQPLFRFQAGGTEIELIWFPLNELRHPPLSPLDNRPLQRASLNQLRSLMEC
jgi:hypothetical protein